MKKLAVEVLNLMWLYCMEDNYNTVVPNNPQRREGQEIGQILADRQNGGVLSPQIYQIAIENLCQILNYHFPLSSFFFMNLCVQNMKQNKSVISSQIILRKLIEGAAFPIVPLAYSD
jgi:hypothetical protein